MPDDAATRFATEIERLQAELATVTADRDRIMEHARRLTELLSAAANAFTTLAASLVPAARTLADAIAELDREMTR